MLTKNDLKAISQLFDGAFDRKFAKAFSNGIGEFFEKILAPYLQGEFDKIDNQFKENSEDHDDIFRKLDQNQKEHDEMFVRFDRIENKVDGHERRIRALEPQGV